MINTIRRVERRLRTHLSHYPKFYALVVGVGIVLFWRGVWHTADFVHGSYAQLGHDYPFGTVDLTQTPWWDGPFSLLIGIGVLYLTGAFTSSFIGNELILSGLRGEKKLTEQAESEVRGEVRAIADIKDELTVISQKLFELEQQLEKKDKKKTKKATAAR